MGLPFCHSFVSEVTAAMLLHHLCRASVSLPPSWNHWEFHLGSLTFAAAVTLRGWLRRLVRTVNATVPENTRDMIRPSRSWTRGWWEALSLRNPVVAFASHVICIG
ncbi:hypothetical protein GWK47_001604 [Chionoecetes opilio]|uniref:Uncharacterized protein n=1 Tax=Chionoecetes opilio TaxID=41210 RepID=A0A8J4XTH4_CHIOP|nr:hypothetical protein GWK47_001604 [Chionoecetes opilio]